MNIDRRQSPYKGRTEPAELMAESTSKFINRTKPQKEDDWTTFVDRLRVEVNDWYQRVDKKLENRAIFTRSDQLHFENIGFLKAASHGGTPQYDHAMMILEEKYFRLREIINWTQQRK